MQKQQLLIAILISLAGHLSIISLFLFLDHKPPEMAYGKKEYVVAIDILQTAMTHTPGSNLKKEIWRDETTREEADKSSEGANAAGMAGMASDVPSSSGFSDITGDGGFNITLARIKARIEATKRYPLLAKRLGLEGRPIVLFEINTDGSIKYVEITNSSGDTILDNAAVETIRKAAPLPYYSRPIRLAIKYELKER